MDAVFVFVGIVNHISVNVENTTAIYEVRIEPAVEGQFFVVVELQANIIVYKYLCRSNEEVIVGMATYQFDRLLLLLAPIVEYVAFAYDFKIGEETPLCECWYGDHSNLVDFLHRGIDFRNDTFRDDVLVLFNKVLKIINIADLRFFKPEIEVQLH